MCIRWGNSNSKKKRIIELYYNICLCIIKTANLYFDLLEDQLLSFS